MRSSTDQDDVADALMMAVQCPREGKESIPTDRQIVAFRNSLVRFLDEVDGDLSISELRSLLED